MLTQQASIYIERLQKLMETYSVSALMYAQSDVGSNPAFEFGKHAGVYAGMQRALSLFEEILNEDDKDHGAVNDQ